MTKKAKESIKKLVKDKIQKKLERYSPESEHKPFIEAILSKKNIFIGSFVQSIYTTFGMSIYEQIGQILAEDAGSHADRQYVLKGEINKEATRKISSIWEEVKTNGSSNKQKEIEEVRKLIKTTQNPKRIPESVVDLYVKKQNGEEAYIDITTVKPNKKELETLKRKMLLWAALRLSTNPKANVKTYIAIPYNPYHPKPYYRWTAKCLDPDGDLLVQETLWNYLGNSEDTYKELIETFESLGDELRDMVKSFLKDR